MQRALWLFLTVVALGGAAWLAFGGHDAAPFDDTPFVSPSEPEDNSAAATRIASAATGSDEEIERRELELAQELGVADEIDTDATSFVAIQGRVIDSAGRPVPGARIEPHVRRDARAMFERGGAPAQDVDWRALFRDRPLAKAVVTDQNGVFRVSGAAFGRGSSLELAVDHRDYAPKVVSRDWSRADGDVQLEDVVLAAGATVTGIVVGPTGGTVPGAAVSLLSTDNGRGGRGGRGGPGGGPGGRGGRFGGNDRVLEMVGDVESDAAGHFILTRVPPGDVRLGASAPRHVDGRSDPASAEEGATVDVGQITLGPGAMIEGVVIDPTGAPVAEAEITATVSRNQPEDPTANDPAANGRGNRGQNGGGRGGFGGFNGGGRWTTKTDADGRFALDRVSQASLRIEVRHPRFVDEDVDPVDPLAQLEVRVTLRSSPTARGTVVDAQTGEPIAMFGLRARPMPGMFGLGGRGGRGGQNQAGPDLADIVSRFTEGNPDAAARIAEFQAQMQRDQDWRKQRIGGAGVVPGRTPKPTTHVDGRFEAPDLQPGEFVFDVDAPGYIAIAAGPFQVTTDTNNEGIVIALERGFVLAGRVVDGRTKQPVANARVELALPQLDGGAGADPLAGMRGMGRGGFGAMFGGGRGGNGRDRLADARTDAEGRFELRPLRAGAYALTVDAEGYPGLKEPEYALGTESSNVVLQLDPGARVSGIVHGLEKGARSRLEFTHAETGAQRSVNIDPNDGSYAIEGLLAGGWFVSVQARGGNNNGGGRGNFRDMIGNAVAARSGAAPDVVVPPGGDVRYDVGAESLELAIVTGRVFRNGQPAAGLEVSLVPEGTTPGADPNLERMVRGRMGQLWSSGVNGEDGTFRIESIPPGDYRLEVAQRGGGGRGGRGGPGQGGNPFGGGNGTALYSEPINVRKGQTVDRLVEIRTGAIDIAVTGPDGQPIARGRASLVLAAEAGDRDPSTWSELPSLARLAVRDGHVQSEFVAPGAYKFSIDARGMKPLTGSISVAMSNEPSRLDVRTEVDPNAPADTGNNNAPGGNGPGGNGPGGNGPGGNAGPGAGGGRGRGNNQGNGQQNFGGRGQGGGPQNGGGGRGGQNGGRGGNNARGG